MAGRRLTYLTQLEPTLHGVSTPPATGPKNWGLPLERGLVCPPSDKAVSAPFHSPGVAPPHPHRIGPPIPYVAPSVSLPSSSVNAALQEPVRLTPIAVMIALTSLFPYVAPSWSTVSAFLLMQSTPPCRSRSD